MGNGRDHHRKARNRLIGKSCLYGQLFLSLFRSSSKDFGFELFRFYRIDNGADFFQQRRKARFVKGFSAA